MKAFGLEGLLRAQDLLNSQYCLASRSLWFSQDPLILRTFFQVLGRALHPRSLCLCSQARWAPSPASWVLGLRGFPKFLGSQGPWVPRPPGFSGLPWVLKPLGFPGPLGSQAAWVPKTPGFRAPWVPRPPLGSQACPGFPGPLGSQAPWVLRPVPRPLGFPGPLGSQAVPRPPGFSGFPAPLGSQAPRVLRPAPGSQAPWVPRGPLGSQAS